MCQQDTKHLPERPQAKVWPNHQVSRRYHGYLGPKPSYLLPSHQVPLQPRQGPVPTWSRNLLAPIGEPPTQSCAHQPLIALVYSTVEYAVPAWGHCPNTKKMDVVLNSAMRLISGTLTAAHLDDLPILSGTVPADRHNVGFSPQHTFDENYPWRRWIDNFLGSSDLALFFFTLLVRLRVSNLLFKNAPQWWKTICCISHNYKISLTYRSWSHRIRL